ncbi:GDSL ESTERASE/LIPASE [Salix purpurea]|uniref:GDSL ESTERASE/LIPASE n=1 Tax=Salix purpurea TaxID=77065 RepID=A0A9Q0WU12_SALPP|nr:GDSL ESTERASE/LIPASE [Salix purpurea]
MEPAASIVDKIKGVAKSGQDFVDGLLLRRKNSSRRNPIEILKRLQRESFSDLMKLRDRQDKVERVLSFYKTYKGSPFQETSTLVRGEVDASGAIMMLGDIDQEHCDAAGRAGIKTGISSRLSFQTIVRQKDSILAEFVASQIGVVDIGGVSEGALTLAKVSYTANVNDWFSAIAIPVGAQFRDLDMTANSSNQKHGVTDLSSVGPPLLNQHNDAAIGITVRKSNVIAMMAQSVSGLRKQPLFDGIGRGFGTFGQIVCQLPKGLKFSLMGLQQVTTSSNDHSNLGALAIPVGFLKHDKSPETSFQDSAQPVGASSLDITSRTGYVALKLESELDESTRIGGWIEMKNSNPRHLQWAVNAFDDAEDEFGWGLSLGGVFEGRTNHGRLQAESYVKLNIGKKFCLKPGITYSRDGNAKLLALMLRSNWSF